MGELEDLAGCTINRDITKMTINISQPDIITKMPQEFNKNEKSPITFNTPATPHKWIVRNQ